MASSFRDALTLTFAVSLVCACTPQAFADPVFDTTASTTDSPPGSATGAQTQTTTGESEDPSSGSTTTESGEDPSSEASSSTTGLACGADLQSDPLHCGACDHDCLGGACEGGACRAVVLADDIAFPEGIAATASTVFVSADDGVFAVPQQGGATVAITGSLARGVAVDDQRVYFALLIDEVIGSAALDGSDLQILATTAGSLPWAIALTASEVVWVGADGVRRVAKTGGLVEILAQPDPPEAYVPQGLVVRDDAAYWANNEGTLLRVSLQGGLPDAVATAFSTVGLAATSTHLYTVEVSAAGGTGSVSRVPLRGGALEALMNGQSGTWKLAADDESIYWLADTDRPDAALLRMPLRGGPATVLATELDHPLALAVDDEAIYFSELDGGRVLRLAK
jgi:hypothetical protein